MKKQNLLIGLLIGFTLIACSNNDDDNGGNIQEPEIDNVIKLHKKSETYRNDILFIDKTLNYTSDKKIKSIITNNYGVSSKTITVDYSEGTILSITELKNFDNPSSADENITYNVTIEDNKITLTSDDYKIEINHSQGYVDSTTEFYLALPNDLFEQVFTRDSNQNLISNTSGAFVSSYSNFDSDKMIDPSGTVILNYLSDYFKIFDLKVTKNNPLTATYNVGLVKNPTMNIEYDNFGYAIKTTIESIYRIDYTEHQYIEL